MVEPGAIHIGCVGFGPGHSSSHYFEDLSAVELQQSFVQPPRAATLKRWRASAPPDFAFVVKAWQLVTHEPSSPTYRQLTYDGALDEAGHFRDSEVVRQALARTLEVAGLLEAAAVLFESPTSFSPSALNRRALASFFERCPRDPGQHLIWNPAGLWDESDVLAICDDLDLVPCFDPFAEGDADGRPLPPSPSLYLRPRGLGMDGFSEHQLRWLLEQLEQRPHSYCVFGSALLFDDARRMQRMFEGQLA